jgi:hypothetical protein
MNVDSWHARLPGGILILLLAVAAGTGCSKRPDPETQVANMVAAHNRHDVTGQLAFFAEDASIVVGGQTPVTGTAAIRNLYEADSVMNSELVYSGLVVRGDTVIANAVVERNDLLRLLGVPEVRYLPGTRVVFSKGKIQRVETSRLDQKDWRAMRDGFVALMNWLQTTHPELQQEVQSGRLSGNNATAAKGWLQLAAQWRESETDKGD